MDKASIKLLFFKNSKYPFCSGDVWQFLGYSKHANLFAFLSKDEHMNEICGSHLKHKVGKRSREVLFMSRHLFYSLAKSKGLDDDGQFYQAYLDYKADGFRIEILKFYDSGKKKEWRRGLHLAGGEIAGKFYMRSLNTINIANDLDICPYDLFKYCSSKFYPQRKGKMGTGSEQILRAYGYCPVPYIYFDSLEHEKRQLCLDFLKEVLAEYPLKNEQREMMKRYIVIIQELLSRQLDYDRASGRLGKQAMLSKEDKSVYRKTAMKLHPDKNPDGTKKFLQLQKAYEKGDAKAIHIIAQKEA
jgi:hypothetical protein